MKTALFLVMAAVAFAMLVARWRRPPSRTYRSVDAIIPAYNEESCIAATVSELLKNPYFNQIIVVDDGSTDGTQAVLERLAPANPRLVVVRQKNTGKGGALMAGVARARAQYVFLTDADTRVPPDNDGIGYMIAEMERGADAVGGVPSSNLAGAALLPHIRATVKFPMIIIKRTFQQALGGAPFLISGACGLFKTEVLRATPFSDRTKVEDLDLTWTLVAKGYKVRQTARCVVFPQECNSLKAEWLRWRRWIVGYAVCMRLHWRLLFSCFGVFSILPMFLTAVLGAAYYAVSFAPEILRGQFVELPLLLFPILWLLAAFGLGLISALHHGRPWLVVLAPAAIFFVFMAYALWLLHGLRGLATGREPRRDKPTRYAYVVA